MPTYFVSVCLIKTNYLGIYLYIYLTILLYTGYVCLYLFRLIQGNRLVKTSNKTQTGNKIQKLSAINECNQEHDFLLHT